MRTRQPLAVRAAASPAGLKVWLHCESMELAGELLQVNFDYCLPAVELSLPGQTITANTAFIDSIRSSLCAAQSGA